MGIFYLLLQLFGHLLRVFIGIFLCFCIAFYLLLHGILKLLYVIIEFFLFIFEFVDCFVLVLYFSLEGECLLIKVHHTKYNN